EVRALPPPLRRGRLLLGLRRLRDLQPAEPARRDQGAEPREGAPPAQGRGERGGRAPGGQGEVPPRVPPLAPPGRGAALRPPDRLSLRRPGERPPVGRVA